MTVNELLRFLQQQRQAGRGNMSVMFDTEGQQYDCHLVSIDDASFNDHEKLGMPAGFNAVTLREKHPHRGCGLNDARYQNNLRKVYNEIIAARAWRDSEEIHNRTQPSATSGDSNRSRIEAMQTYDAARKETGDL